MQKMTRKKTFPNNTSPNGVRLPLGLLRQKTDNQRPGLADTNKDEKNMEQNNHHTGKATEPTAMTYGMSDELRNSDLLSRISSLSLSDKQCLIRYISEEVEVNSLEEDEWDRQDTTGLQPYTMDELYARIEASEEDVRNGRILTVEESRRQLREKYLWLQ